MYKVELKTWKRGKLTLAAPTLLHYEVIAATRKFVYQKRLTEVEGVTIRETLLGYGLKLYHDKALLRRAYELATQLNRPTAYDSQYLALAERLDTEFWTADERLYNAARASLAYVRWLGEVVLPPL